MKISYIFFIVIIFFLHCFFFEQVYASTRFSISIGNNIGQPSTTALKWAEEDAKRVNHFLIELANVPKKNAILVLGESKDKVQKKIEAIKGIIKQKKKPGNQVELFVFYSGHGDINNLHLGSTLFSIDDFLRSIKNISADTTITIIDACRSGSLKRGRGKGAAHAPPFDINIVKEPKLKGSIVISSAGANEIAQESDDIRGSFFTHHMLSAFRGAADNDSDGYISLQEFYNYTYNKTLYSSHGTIAATQHPEYKADLKGEGEFIISYLKKSKSRLIISKDLFGNLLVVDDKSGKVILELDKSRSSEYILAVPDGRYRIQVKNNKQVFAGEVSLDWGGEAYVSKESLTKQPLKLAMLKGSSLNPDKSVVLIHSNAGLPLVLYKNLYMGAGIGYEYTLNNNNLFLSFPIRLNYSKGKNHYWSFRHFENQIGTGIGYKYDLGLFQTSVKFHLGMYSVIENIIHNDADRIKTFIKNGKTESNNYSIGPWINSELEARIPLYKDFGVLFGTGFQTAWFIINEEWTNSSGVHFFMGFSYII